MAVTRSQSEAGSPPEQMDDLLAVASREGRVAVQDRDDRDPAFQVATGSPRRREESVIVPMPPEAVGPEVRGPRMTVGPDRPVAEGEPGPRADGDPTVSGGGRMGVSPDNPRPPRVAHGSMESLVVLPPPTPAWARTMKRASAPLAGPVPGMAVERPRTLEVIGQPGPTQASLVRPGGPGRDAVSRRLDFQHQRFEFIRIRRPMLESPVGGASEPAAWPVYISDGAQIGNGLLAQLIAARFGDHDTLDGWARSMTRLGHRVTGARLSEAVIAASTCVAPVWQALQDAVIADADGIDDGDLAARVPEGRRMREGRVRGVSGGGQLWFSWREAEDLSPVLPRGSRAEPSGHRAFDLLEDSVGRSRAGRWARLRQRLHALLPQDPDRAGFALHLAHRVRRTMTGSPDPESVGAAAGAFRRWLDARRREFDAPRSPLERFVIGALAEWADLAPVDEAGSFAPPLHTLRTGRQSPVMSIDPRDGPPEDILAWHSLVESCHALGLRPWDYLHELLHAAAHGLLDDPEGWTPARWSARGRS